ncbi:MAG: hypothetical protein ACLFM4_07180 [Phormidium sp.]
MIDLILKWENQRMCPQRDKLGRKTTLKSLTKNTPTEGDKPMLSKIQKGLGELRNRVATLKNYVAEVNNRERQEVDSHQQEFPQNSSVGLEDTYPEDLRETSHSPDHQSIQQRIPVELCLIVPARLVSNFSRDQPLTRTEICHLIDNCAYFCCLPAKDLHSLEQDLQPTSEPILHSERDVYIRIQIEDGENMIDNSSCYGLKKRLPQTGGVIQECKLLANLSGRQHFNRI